MEREKMATLLVVDDEPIIVELLACLLGKEYRIEKAENGEQALSIARRGHVDLILLDVVMPVLGGFEVCETLKNDPRTSRIPVLFLTAENAPRGEAVGFRSGGVDYIIKPFAAETVKARIKHQLELSTRRRELELSAADATRWLDEAGLEIVRQLGRVAELREGDTGEHVTMVSSYAYHIALKAGLSREQAELLRTVAPLHDLGKLGVPDHILLKQGPLDPEEWGVVQTHCEVGYRIIGEHQSRLISTAALCAYCHHERWDGRGYPRGLRGESIPIEARIIAVADAFDALTRERPYKEAWPVERAVREVIDCGGTQFDPFVVHAFLRALPEIMSELQQRTRPHHVPAVKCAAKERIHGC